MQVLAMKVAADVQPTGVDETDGVDDHRVSVPVAQRFSFPRSIQILQWSMGAAVRWDNPVLVSPSLGPAAHIQEDQLGRRLHDLRRSTHTGNSARHTSIRWIFSV